MSKLGQILSDTYNEVAPMYGDDRVAWDEYSASDQARIREIATRFAAVIEARARSQVAQELRAYAERVRSGAFTPSAGVALAALVEECAKIAEGPDTP